MSNPTDTPAAAWYPDPQTSGQVRWWDGTKWTEHVSAAAQAVETPEQAAQADPAAAEPEPTPESAPVAAEYVPYGRHAAGIRSEHFQTSRPPQLRPRERAEQPVDSLLYA